MTTPLWTAAEIAAATGGTASTDFAVTGVAFDSREVGAGDLFVALTGEATDGHRFLDQAFAQGAAGAIVSQPTGHPHVLVADTFVALNDLARASRARIIGADRRGHRIGGQDQREGGAVRRARPVDAGQRSTGRSKATTTTPASRSASRACRAIRRWACSKWG